MRKIVIYIIVSFGILLSNCEKNNDKPGSVNIDKTIIVDKGLYKNAANDEFNFTNAEIEGDSLKLTIEYGGGCGDIKIMLIDSEAILESYPVQRNIRVSLKDDDFCEALLSIVITFDLRPVRVSDIDKVSLNLAGWNYPLLYEY